MNNIPDYHHVRFTLAGAARSGLSCAKLLKKFSAQVFVTDEKKLSPETENILKDAKIPYEHAGHSLQKISANTDVLVISPGILLSSPLVIHAKQNNIPVISEVEVASWFFPENIICFGITGTNGKSTTTNYLASLLQINNNSIACGNIGKSVSEVILEMYENNVSLEQSTYLSIELSSYQLETIYSLRPHCTCFLNLQNDHLARYESMDEYLKAKWRLILLTREDGLTIIGQDVLLHAIKLGLSMPKCSILVLSSSDMSTKTTKDIPQLVLKKLQQGINLPIALYKDLKKLPFENLIPPFSFDTAKIFYNTNKNSANILFARNNTKFEWNIENSCLNGAHNIQNILTASLMAEFIGLPRSFIFQQWEKKTTKYVHLAHRLEVIGKENQVFIDANKNKKKVLVINDSKATNVESTLVALKSFNKPIRLLIGGEPKGDSYLPISNLSQEHKITIYPFGKAAPIISQELSGLKNTLSKNSTTMITAAHQALLDCNDEEIILLSPACASFDEFKDYEHRGNVFRAWAISCFEENNS